MRRRVASHGNRRRSSLASRPRYAPFGQSLLAHGDVNLRISAGEPTRCFELWQESGPRIVSASVDGRPVTSFVRFSDEADALALRRLTGDQSRPGWHLQHCGAGTRTVTVSLGSWGRQRRFT